MGKFLSLPEEKQNKIIDAALTSFGTNGYKKTSVSDIAGAAGISKAMIFHYFGTKKALYLYLVHFALDLIINEVNEKFDPDVTDFFERIRLSTEIEISVMKKHPAILSFINSAYFEKDDEVEEDIKAIFAGEEGEKLRYRIALEGMDASKFKEGIDPKLVLKILVWFTEGYLSKLPGKTGFDLDAISKEFEACMNLLRSNFYKEEYL